MQQAKEKGEKQTKDPQEEGQKKKKREIALHQGEKAKSSWIELYIKKGRKIVYR
jgi:hypothetical protein